MNSAEAVRLFGQKRAEIVKYIETNQDNLRGYVIGRIDNPPDVYQVLLWLVGHAEGHAEQIRATRASPGFPK